MTEEGMYCTPLKDAISTRNCNQVQLLVALGVDINRVLYAGCPQTPLFHSIEQYAFASNCEHTQKINETKSYAIFRYLLSHGAHYNQANRAETSKYTMHYAQSTPLHIAAEKKTTILLLKDLLSMPNINLNARNSSRQTALDCAKKNAMNRHMNVKYRKHFYSVCALLESAGAQNSVMLEPMPTDEIMKQEYELNFHHWQAHYDSSSYAYIYNT